LCAAISFAAAIILDKSTLPTGLTGLSILVAGSAQFVAAFRSPRTYAVALALAVAAVLVIMAGTPMGWMNVLPRWDSLPVAVTSLPLAIGSLVIAVFFPFRYSSPYPRWDQRITALKEAPIGASLP
jgi:hypothetical protein